MPAPILISDHASAAEAREHEVSLTAVTTIGQDAAVKATERFDLRSLVMNRIVSIAWPPPEIAITRRSRRTSTWRLQDQRWFFDLAAVAWSRVGISVPSTIQDRRRSRSVVSNAASRRTRSVTMRCACERDIANTGQLTKREVCAQREADDAQAVFEGAGPGSARPFGRSQAIDEGGQRSITHAAR
jgi:hypothetical protein